MKALLFPLLLILFLSCKKTDTIEEQLPPATHTGAGTFGCRINGKVFVPKGYNGTGRANPHVIYDYDLQGRPFLSIEANRFKDRQIVGSIYLLFSDISSVGNFEIPSKLSYSVGWIDIIPGCGMGSLDTTVIANGLGVITNLNVNNRIISGTFNFNAIKLGCDTVYITDGRFDIKL
ncbi:hypothetical protein JST56_03385 [Candidatus Dependentiae bacterium]|nr:hypothetical protein [Candidatus Dependentiae bacterium]